MSTMIEDLLALARVARAKIVSERVNLGALAKEVASDLQQSEPERDVRFVVPPAIIAQGDPGLLRVVFENLLGNSWKFTSKSSQASIEAGEKENGNVKTYFVRDNGAGFDMRYADKLFRPSKGFTQEILQERG